MTDRRSALEGVLRESVLPDDAHDGPLVSMVIPTRNGLHHLRRLFRGLASRTAYRRFEVVVVDNASTDGTRAWLARPHGFPVTVIENDENASFSRANNQAIERVGGDLTLVLNNDVEPVERDWLSRLVAAFDDDQVMAAGPLLVYPERTAPPGDTFRHPDLTVQHAGVGFLLRGEKVRARNLGAGDDPIAPGRRTTREVGALSAACLLLRTSVVRDLGGFDEAYFYGSEDWDLSLRLRERGGLVLVGGSVLYHHEFGTQRTFESRERAAYRRRNHAHFNGVWGPRVRRRFLLEQLGDVRGPGRISDERPTFVLAPGASAALTELGRQLEDAGWARHESSDEQPTLGLTEPGGAAVQPRASLSVAVRSAGRVAPLADGLDLVVREDPDHEARPVGAVDWYRLEGPPEFGLAAGPPECRGSALLETLRAFVARPRFAIRTCNPDLRRPRGDPGASFAWSLRGALARAGYAAVVHGPSAWGRPGAHTHDVVVHMRGDRRYRPRSGAHNVLWIVGGVDDVTADELDAFDLVLVASSQYATEVAARTGTRVEVLHVAADATRFHPVGRTPHPGAAGLVVRSDAGWPPRHTPRWLMELGWEFALYGDGWDGLPEARHVVAGTAADRELSDVYAQADVVVVDQPPELARDGFVTTDLLEAVAAGAFVLARDTPGVREVLGEDVARFRTRDELNALVGHHLARPTERARRSDALTARVRRDHTADRRVQELLALIGDRRTTRGLDLL